MTTDRENDKRTIGLTTLGRETVDGVLSRGFFKDKLDVAKFAMANAIHSNVPAAYVSGTDTTWNVGSFDPDGEIRGLIQSLYPKENTPYRFIEGCIDAGLSVIKQHMQARGGLDVAELMEPISQTTEKFGEYTLLDSLSGGMAETYLSQKDGSDEKVFLKRVRKATTDEASLARETRIYEKLTRLNIEHVLEVKDFGHVDDYIFIATEFAGSGDLSAYVESQPGRRLAPGKAKEIALQVIEGIAALHDNDIVHRDIKPENILKSQDRWKIADFGISKNLARLITQRTFQQAGTLGYAPQEQFDGVEAHTSADIHAFGKLLVFLLTGQTDTDRLQLPAWRELVRRCTERDRDQRPTAALVREQLSEIMT